MPLLANYLLASYQVTYAITKSEKPQTNCCKTVALGLVSMIMGKGVQYGDSTFFKKYKTGNPTNFYISWNDQCRCGKKSNTNIYSFCYVKSRQNMVFCNGCD